MANTKVTQHVIANNAIQEAMITNAAVTPDKLHGTLDLSSKTLTLPSAQTATTQSASDNSTKIATTAYVETAISNLVDSSPSSLNTLNELAAALNDDASFSTTVTNSIATKLPLAGGTMTGNIAHASHFTIDAGGDIHLDTGGQVKLDLNGTLFGNLFPSSGNLGIHVAQQDKDLIISGNDGGSGINALVLDMSEGGFATFNDGGSFGGTGALKIPVGTTGQRPTAATGQIRWNSTDGALEVYNGSAWTAVGTGSSNKILNTFTGDGSTTTFTLTVTPANEDALMVFIDGAYQEAGDYVLTNNQLALDTAPLSGEKVSAHITTASVHDGTSAVNQQFTGDGSTTAFTLSSAPGSENNTQIYINGVYQQKTDYTVSGTTLTFDTAPTSGDIIEVNMFTVTTLGNSDTVTEGVSNLYHTSARTISALSGATLTGNLTMQNASSPTLKLVDTTQSSDLRLFAQNSNVGIGTFSNHDMRFYTNSTSRLAIDNSGKVGIGTDSPGATLHVAHGSDTSDLAQFSGGHTGRYLAIRSFQNNSLDGAGFIFNASSSGGAFKFQTATTDRVIIDKDGKVGIGTTNPTDVLTVAGNITVSDGSPEVTFQTGASHYNWQIAAQENTNSAFEIAVGSQDVDASDDTFSPLMTVLQTGKVGIGTQSPAQQLTVSSSGITYSRVTTTASTQAAVQEVVNNTGGGLSIISYSNSASGTLFGFNRGGKTFIDSSQETVIGTSGSNFLSLATDSTERIRIDGDNVLIKTTNTSQSSGSGVKFINTRLYMVNALTSGEQISYYGNGGYKYYVSVAGKIHTAVGPAVYSVSDERLKENIRDYDKGLADILKLKPRLFDWKEGEGSNEKNVSGFVAQECEAAGFDEFVGDFKHDTLTDAKSFGAGGLITAAIKAIQEQQVIIDDLKARIETLEG